MAHYADRLLAFIKVAEQATQQAKERVLREAGITVAQQAALTILSDHDGLTAAELARRCQVTPQTMNSTVGRMEARGLVERVPHPMHGTLIEIRLTQRGREVFGRADARIEALDSDLASGLSPAELQALKEMLARVTAAASRSAAAAAAAGQ
jgi:DNA-binding MarR family transcriptional regulator